MLEVNFRADDNSKPKPWEPSLEDIQKMTPEEILRTKWVIDLPGYASSIATNMGTLMAFYSDQSLISMGEVLSSDEEIPTKTEVDDMLVSGLAAMWLHIIRRERDRRIQAALGQ